MATVQSPMTVVETETFLASAVRLGISETERTALIIYLAGNPEVGSKAEHSRMAQRAFFLQSSPIIPMP